MNYKMMIKTCRSVFAAVLCVLPLSLSAQIPSTEEMYGILEKQYSAGNFDKDITCTLSLIIENRMSQNPLISLNCSGAIQKIKRRLYSLRLKRIRNRLHAGKE